MKTNKIFSIILILCFVLAACAPNPNLRQPPQQLNRPQLLSQLRFHQRKHPVPTEVPPTEVPTEKPQPQAGERYHVGNGGFSYIIPEGWIQAEFPGLKYEILATAELVDGVMSNIILLTVL